MSRANLIEAYIAALPTTVVSVLANSGGKRARIETGAPAAGETVHARLHFKASHAELVLDAVPVDGWADMPPAELLERVTSTAEQMGATWQTEEEVMVAARKAVAIVVERVDALNRSGGLKEINADYKRYRQRQMAKAERAIPYAVYLQKYNELMVTQVAARVG